MWPALIGVHEFALEGAELNCKLYNTETMFSENKERPKFL